MFRRGYCTRLNDDLPPVKASLIPNSWIRPIVSSGIHLSVSSGIHLNASSRKRGTQAHCRSKRHSWHSVCLSSTSMTQELLGREYPRRRLSVHCLLTWQERQILGTMIDASYSGLALSVSSEAQLSAVGEVLIHIPGAITVRARPVYIHPTQGEDKRVGFKIASIERGEERWHSLQGDGRI